MTIFSLLLVGVSTGYGLCAFIHKIPPLKLDYWIMVGLVILAVIIS